MGLLDDAIREHLELKRRHGADPSEVERQEHEALGPARRGAAPADEADLTEADAGPLEPGAVSVGTLPAEDDRATALYDDDDEPELATAPPPAPADDDVEPAVPVGEPEAPVAPPAPVDEPDEPAVDEPEPERYAADEAPVDAEVVGEPEPEPAPRAAAGDDPEAAPAEDVLEETPDFLQETPEHDRLWFEQKPPRDFEF
jgi:hypothetical protein